jgi:hypothetical protein
MISEEDKNLLRSIFQEAMPELTVETHYHVAYDNRSLGYRNHACPPRVGEFERMDGTLYKVVRVIWEQGPRGQRIANIYMDRIDEEGSVFR